MTEILVSLGALIALVLGAWGKGRYDARQDVKKADQARQAETKERMDAVVADDKPDDARDWLRERGK